MRALVTGAAGFVGHYLVRHLRDAGDDVCASDVDTLDVTDRIACEKLVSSYRPEVLYHLAGIAFVPEAERDFARALRINVLGTQQLLRACALLKEAAPVRFLLVSSGEVYGRIAPQDLPLHEECPLRPANNYSLSKLMAEQVGARYDQAGTVRVVTARPFNHIGAGQNDRFVVSSFAKQLASIALGHQEAVIRVGNLEGKRDFSDVRDIVRAYRLAALKGQGIYNLGSSRSVAIKQILSDLIAIAKLTVRIEPDPERMRASEVPEIRSDCSRAKRELGWEPEYSLKESLTAVYQYWYETLAAQPPKSVAKG